MCTFFRIISGEKKQNISNKNYKFCIKILKIFTYVVILFDLFCPMPRDLELNPISAAILWT